MHMPLNTLVTLCLLSFLPSPQLKAANDTSKNLFKIPFKTITGEDTTLAAHQNKVIMIVNVASKCGRTPQYKNLQSLHEKYGEKGLVILGFPANDFGRQEPGTNEEIQAFCKREYMVKFPLMSKISVKGDKQHPLYKHLIKLSDSLGAKNSGEVKWNFEKFLIGRDGKLVARFRSKTLPDSPKALNVIKKALAVDAKKKSEVSPPPDPAKSGSQVSMAKTDKTKELNDAEKKFVKLMTGATLKGHYTNTDNPGKLFEDAYEIRKIEKMNDKFWAFHANVKYNKKSIPVAIPLPITWSDGTPIVSLTHFNIPGLGKFSARLVFFENQYAGIWIAHGKDGKVDHGGQMFGKIEK